MIKLKAPSKDSTIYHVVSWLNRKILSKFSEREISPPKNSCQLFWQSILWFWLLLNLITSIIITLSGVSLTFNILPYDAIEYFKDIPILFTGVGIILGCCGGTILIGLFYILKSVVFWSAVLAYLLLCAIFWVGFKYTKLFKGYRTKAPLLVIGWIGVCFVLGSTVEGIIAYLRTNTKFHKFLSKFKVSCEDIN